jgi:acyl-CoA ligase (AMP-forming) (exosortase A-associated)
MTELLHELILRSAGRAGATPALKLRNETLRYEELAARIERFAQGLLALGTARQERVAVYLPKQFETVIGMFGAARAGCVFVPVNPLLKAAQVGHILRDCNVRVLVTSAQRARELRQGLGELTDLRHLVLIDGDGDGEAPGGPALATHSWKQLLEAHSSQPPHRVIDGDVVSIFYTSGSTGKPKGVVLSHRNMVTGAHSVSQYLENSAHDRLLAVLPFSFDYGFSQLSTAFLTGACVVLIDYLFPKDVVAAVAKERITGLAGVPPLWMQLADLQWPSDARESLRYITNSGGAMPVATLGKLRTALPATRPFLMYGLTEAFRSTYLPPEQIDTRPESIGKAIPNAEVMVVRPDGTPCAPNEPGELVHRGALVSLGYWNDAGKTAERFKPVPGQDPGLVLQEMAVWSGDTVRLDEEGFIFFMGRRDEMIKTSGYRVSPSEVEEVLYSTGLVADAVALGVAHPGLGQAVVVVTAPAPGGERDTARLLDECRRRLPNFMVPAHVEWRDSLPRNPNGKFDRTLLASELKALFVSGSKS